MKQRSEPKWTGADYDYPLQVWKPPKLVYPCHDTEKQVLRQLIDTFAPLPPYAEMEAQARVDNTLVTLDTPEAQAGYFPFLENCAEECTSPTSKHSENGMKGARHWVQRVDTAERIFQRLTDGYGISLMFGERFHQYIRNSNNWRGASGTMLDIDDWRVDIVPGSLEHQIDTLLERGKSVDEIVEETEAAPKDIRAVIANSIKPDPVFSEAELFDRYPLLKEICSFVLPSASSLWDGRPFKARGVILFQEPITDQRVFHAFGDLLLAELDCIPANVTKNPLSVGFGNTHNAPQAHRNNDPDVQWLQEAITQAERTVLEENVVHETRRKKREARQREYKRNVKNGTISTGENISAFIEQCDPIAEMVREGLLIQAGGNRYKWHESQSESSCENVDGKLRIYSATMQAASPGVSGQDAVNAHRFYLYQATGLDFTRDADKEAIRDYLFSQGYGSDPAAYQAQRPKQRLHRDDTGKQETLETLERNRDARGNATDNFFSQDSELLHIQLVKDFTGTGKSYTALAKAKQHNKRTLVQLPHTELAEQAIALAYELGFTNPFHIVGREQNWHDSGIAEIPPQDRTDALFAKNNCIMVDVVKAYQEKRLSPRNSYCESRCEFREGCVYLSQYEGLGQRDFLTNCTPNLLFDLNMRGFLVSLVMSGDDPTSEDLAIDAQWGTTSETVKEFDYAILDDYGINGLYWDVTFRESEFKTLKKVWKGTPTGDFAKSVLKAFKKESPRQIFKALRKAFDESEAHHAEIAERLTQHARRGDIRYLDAPKGSKETKRLLAEKEIQYADGGKQLVPVDFQAYQELTGKGLPSVHPSKLQTQDIGDPVIIPHAPQKALSAGIPLDDFTPVWQSGATPIELLGILISSVGKAKNAPVNLNKGVISFSLPPQAPIGLLPHITMLSATTDIEDTRRAFQGQAVTFSEHTGKTVQWADGVQVYQFQDARLTSASVFEYPTDGAGKRLLQEKTTGLTTTAEERLRKLNDWAADVEGITAFISYKEFTETFTEAVCNFDIVTHFDKVSGLNFEGLKFLVIFGYPKVRHEDVIAQVRRQFASDTETLPAGSYEELTNETEYQADSFTIFERRYKDPRLERIRHQLATEKLEQAIGRARLPVWTQTQTIIFTDAPIPSITNHATLFSGDAFNLAESPSDIVDATRGIKEAEDAGDVQAIMETQGVSERTAYRRKNTTQSKADRNAEICHRFHTLNEKPAEIADTLTKNGCKVSESTVRRVLNSQPF